LREPCPAAGGGSIDAANPTRTLPKELRFCSSALGRVFRGKKIMRHFTRLAFVPLALSIFPCSTASSARDIAISHQWAASIDARDRAARVFVNEVEARLPDLHFQIHPQLALQLKAEEQFDALQAGKLAMSVYPLPYAAKKIPEFSLAVLPGLFRSVEAARALKNSKVSDRLQDIANANGVHILAWWWVAGGFVSRAREIAGPETVKGLRLRSGDTLFDLMLSRAGAIPVDLKSNELYAAMQADKLDGALTSYETFVSERLYEHAKHFTAGSPGIWMFANPLLISKALWDSLSATEKEVFEAAAEISETYFVASQNDAETRFIKTFTGAGAKYHKFSREDYLAWLRLAQQTAWKEYFALSPTTESMLLEVVHTLMEEASTK
jgi:TRAP-type transport system periplasmic protein